MSSSRRSCGSLTSAMMTSFVPYTRLLRSGGMYSSGCLGRSVILSASLC
nr:MAG TPA: hypothetical protein [Caudoviricetes sp.]DAM28751.1 MAG TPA: hypothetical protein [Caudoviricetes sp.]